MTDGGPLKLEQLDQVLGQVVRENPEKVVSWVRGEAGAWGFLAGQGVTAARRELGRSLTDPERRMVWSRLWWWLEQLKLRLQEPQ
jgi:hypothetical protein